MNITQDFTQLFKSFSPQWELFEDKSFVVYGAGSFGQWVARVLTNQQQTVKYFLDQREGLTSINDIPVYQPQRHQCLDKNVVVVIGVFNAYVDLQEIYSFLKKAGFLSILNAVEFYHHFPQPLSERFWLSQIADYRQYQEEIIAGYDYWADENSKYLYLKLWEYRLTGEYSCLPVPSGTATQYFPTDIPKWTAPLRLIDCGAYTGDTLENFQEAHIPLDTVIAFEPDLKNFSKLVETSKHLQVEGEIYLYPCGAYSKTQLIRFNSNEISDSSSISETGEEIIQVVSIDECLPYFFPTLIKMDIEGAEIPALLGAQKIIRKYRPGLAICAYHRPHDIWQIPKIISEWHLEYKFYLRTHGYSEFDSVIYGISQT